MQKLQKTSESPSSPNRQIVCPSFASKQQALTRFRDLYRKRLIKIYYTDSEQHRADILHELQNNFLDPIAISFFSQSPLDLQKTISKNKVAFKKYFEKAHQNPKLIDLGHQRVKRIQDLLKLDWTDRNIFKEVEAKLIQILDPPSDPQNNNTPI